MDDSPLITLKQVRELLGVSKSELNSIRRERQLGFPEQVYLRSKPTFLRFYKSQVLAWRAANVTAQPEGKKPAPARTRRARRAT